MPLMDPANARAVDLLDVYGRRSMSVQSVDLDVRYLRAIDRVETLPENRERADKSWVEASRRDFRDYIARARRARPKT